MKCAMSVKELKNHISGQGKIYIRPIQRSLSPITLVLQRHKPKIKKKMQRLFRYILCERFEETCPSAGVDLEGVT